LTVTGRTSSFAYKGKTGDLRIIGKELGVDNLLEGSVRKDGKDLRITAQLNNSSNGAHLWSHTYDRELSKVFELQEEIAKDVATALRIKLDVGETRRASGGTTNVEAYDKFLRGNAAINQRDMSHALQYMNEAVELDPDYVNAWWAILASGVADRPERAKARQRLEMLAPNSWQAILPRTMALLPDRKWIEAAAGFKAAHYD
jgi:tetratricopeptide (TPR) repeat protein